MEVMKTRVRMEMKDMSNFVGTDLVYPLRRGLVNALALGWPVVVPIRRCPALEPGAGLSVELS